jgi:hypothetical protein
MFHSKRIIAVATYEDMIIPNFYRMNTLCAVTVDMDASEFYAFPITVKGELIHLTAQRLFTYQPRSSEEHRLQIFATI